MIDKNSTKEEVLEAIIRDCDELKFASDELRADREFMLEVFEQTPLAFLHASDKLKADRGVVVAAVTQDSRALECASKELQAELS